jgi:phosphoribosylformylglycinamidine cyclo-ligase
MTSYAKAGVDIDAANQAKRMIADAVRSTHNDAVLAGMGAFGGAFDLAPTVAQYAQPVLVASTDGVGTKTLVARAVGQLRGVGQDLVNHCINDVLVQGARPLFFLDYIASARLEPREVAEVVGGVADACRAAGCALLGGETAEMPGVYQSDAFDLAGTLVGVVDRTRFVDGSTIRPGDVVLGLPSTGLHTNGYSLARRVCDPLGYDQRPAALGGASLGEALLAIHRSYLPDVEQAWGAGVTIKGMAHITGGGLLENVPRTLPQGTGVRLRRGSWTVPPIFQFLVQEADMDEHEALRVFNMGVGMVLVVAPDDAERLATLLPDIERIGEVVAGESVEIV